MSIRERDTQGRIRSGYADADLYDAVAEVAVLVRPDHPEALTVREFNSARAEAGHPKAPPANGICQRLNRKGKAGSWPKIVAAACDEGTSIAQVEAARTSTDSPEPDAGAIYFALRMALQWHREERDDVGKTSLRPSEYEEARLALVEKSLRKRDRRMLLHECLPTLGQITNAASSIAEELELLEIGWNAALEIAELEPISSQPTKKGRQYRGQGWERALPIEQLIHRFVEENGFLPTSRAIMRFAKEADVALEENKDRTWSECLEAAVEYRRQGGLSTAGANRPGKLRGESKPFQVPAAGIPDAKPAHAHTSTYSEDDMIEAVVEFLDALNPKLNPNQKRYGAWATRHGRPAVSTLGKRNSWSYFLAEARKRRRQGGP